ncbi:hypothetical protein HK101_001547 [Irineochytrium annulatum]|nr:hypothetical protein HK101_001547 [Irineochytrium annulatum]
MAALAIAANPAPDVESETAATEAGVLANLEELPFSLANCHEDFHGSSLNTYFSAPATTDALFTLLASVSPPPLPLSPSAQTAEGAPFYIDLGCGDGRLCVAFARRFGLKCLGVDLDVRNVEDATRMAVDAGVEALCAFEVKDLVGMELPRTARWVSAYLPKEVTGRLGKIIQPWLRDDTEAGGEEISQRRKVFGSILYRPKGWEGKECAKDDVYKLWAYNRGSL